MNSNEYNGYPNRATWNVVLWLNNDYGIYKDYIAHKERNGKFTATSAKQYVTDMWPSGKTPDNCNLSDVKWAKVASSLNE